MKVLLRSIWGDLRREFGGWIEPFSSWENADAHRMYWRPDKVKVILLAESHVFTNEAEANLKCNVSRFSDESVPQEFVRLVYCLGYGENSLLNQSLKSNAGTSDFWKIFYSCVHQVESNRSFDSILTGQSTFDIRIQAKLKLLQTLKMQGVWLLDASLAALYPKPNCSKMYLECLDKSWPYIRSLIIDAKPKKIIIIGKTVWNRFLKNRIPSLKIPFCVQVQPQGRPKSHPQGQPIKTLQRYYDLIHSVNVMTKSEPSCLLESNVFEKAPSPQSCCNWTFNQRTKYYSQRVPLLRSSLVLNLWFRESYASPKSNKPIVESCWLDLYQLLENGVIKYDGDQNYVRIVIVRKKDGLFYIQSKEGAPSFLLESDYKT